MAKNDKKITKLQDRINELEAAMKDSLGKKKSNVVAFDVPGTLRKIEDLKKDITRLK